MRVRALAQVLYDGVAGTVGQERSRRIEAFLGTISRSRRWKLLPRIVAALERIEIEAGAPPMTIVASRRDHAVPDGAVAGVQTGLIGGARVRSGDTMVDTSLQTQLRTLAQHLTA